MIFAAYPAYPPYIDQVFRSAATKISGTAKTLHCWPENDSSGRLITDPIFEQILNSEFIISDITKLNFNVIFEAGYAIGKNKYVFYTINSGSSTDKNKIREAGLFDTIGYDAYENTDQLAELILEMHPHEPFSTNFPRNVQTPIYVVEHKTRTDGLTRIFSRIKKAHIRYRSFNPQEHIRLSAFDAIQNVSESSGVVVPLASSRLPEHEVHNIRAAFVAGLSIGLGRPTLIIQDYDGPAPLDVRELVKAFKHPDEINDHIADFAEKVLDELQSAASPTIEKLPPLAKLSIGDPMAENEMASLSHYYVTTDEFNRVSEGDANLVVGRKGMGKTALFVFLRNIKRLDVHNIVVDLKPEGYQIIKLREEILDYITEGAKQHLFVAFWEYILYLEIAYKLLEKDKERHLNDNSIYDIYCKLEKYYEKQEGLTEGDFSERLLILSDLIRARFKAKYGKDESIHRLTRSEVTELIYSYELPKIRKVILEYLTHKKSVWILFDNLDKGWPPEGIDEVDALILRCLVDATKKIVAEISSKNTPTHSVVFIRNDVFELLMSNSADFGKELKVSLDWSDPDTITSIIKKRMIDDDDVDFKSVWNKYFVPLYKGEDTFTYFVERSLYRPRNLIKMILHCKGYAINLRRDKIDSECITKGLYTYSNDVLQEADEELSDIEPKARGLLYTFIGDKSYLGYSELESRIVGFCKDSSLCDKIIHYLLYYGFFGVEQVGKDPKYIYDVRYNMNLLKGVLFKFAASSRLTLNPAFWPILEITE